MILNEMPIIELRDCHFDRDSRVLTVSSEKIGMPRAVRVSSNYTGRIVQFSPITPSHPRFDSDLWDGEMRIYEPDEPIKNVDLLIISNLS